MSGVGVGVESSASGVDVAVEGEIVSTGNVLRGVGLVGVTVGVSVIVGVRVAVAVGVAVINAAAVAVSASGSIVSVGVFVNVAVGVICFCSSVARKASVTRETAARSAIAVSCCGEFADRVQASEGISANTTSVQNISSG